MLRPTRRRVRNPVATSPLLRKGGVHKQSKSGLRANANQALRDEIDNWREQFEEDCFIGGERSRNESGNDSFCICLLS